MHEIYPASRCQAQLHRHLLPTLADKKEYLLVRNDAEICKGVQEDISNDMYEGNGIHAAKQGRQIKLATNTT